MIVDTFCFFNELSILDIRLATLDPYVDYFVLVEATRTHSNHEKPLFFQQNKGRYAKYLSKIVHVIVDEFPSDTNAWHFEHFQRNCIVYGLNRISKLSDDDIVMFSDVDEIPDPKEFKKFSTLDEYNSIIFNNRLYYCFLNMQCISQQLHGLNPWTFLNTRAMKYSVAKNLSGDDARRLNDGVILTESGWHFSFMGGMDSVTYKLQSFAHQEYNKPEYLNKQLIYNRIVSGQDPLGREFQFMKMELDNTFPEYIVQKKESLVDLII